MATTQNLPLRPSPVALQRPNPRIEVGTDVLDLSILINNKNPPFNLDLLYSVKSQLRNKKRGKTPKKVKSVRAAEDVIARASRLVHKRCHPILKRARKWKRGKARGNTLHALCVFTAGMIPAVYFSAQGADLNRFLRGLASFLRNNLEKPEWKSNINLPEAPTPVDAHILQQNAIFPASNAGNIEVVSIHSDTEEPTSSESLDNETEASPTPSHGKGKAREVTMPRQSDADEVDQRAQNTADDLRPTRVRGKIRSNALMRSIETTETPSVAAKLTSKKYKNAARANPPRQGQATETTASPTSTEHTQDDDTDNATDYPTSDVTSDSEIESGPDETTPAVTIQSHRSLVQQIPALNPSRNAKATTTASKKRKFDPSPAAPTSPSRQLSDTATASPVASEPPVCQEPIPEGPVLKKRNPFKMANEELEAENRFLKNMFLYGLGVKPADLLVYKMRVEKMKYTHRLAWDQMTGKRSADNAARRASGNGAAVSRVTR